MFGYDPSKNDLPDNKNPALIDPTSPELTEKYQGVDFGATTCDGLVLSPILFSYFLKFADPLFDETAFQKERDEEDAIRNLTPKESTLEASAATVGIAAVSAVAAATAIASEESTNTASEETTTKAPEPYTPVNTDQNDSVSIQFKEGIFLNQLQQLKDETKQRIVETNEKLDQLNNDS